MSQRQNQNSEIQVVVIVPGQEPEIRSVSGDLKSLQSIVEGRIEFFPLNSEDVPLRNVAMIDGICNEDFLQALLHESGKGSIGCWFFWFKAQRNYRAFLKPSFYLKRHSAEVTRYLALALFWH